MDFNSILSTKVEEAEKPKPLPVGTYIWQIPLGQPKFDQSKEKQTPFVEWEIKPVAPLDDVDGQLLQQVKNWNEKSMRLTFWLTEEALYRFRDFLDKVGIPYKGRSWAEVIPEVAGKNFKASVVHNTSIDKATGATKGPYANLDDSSFAAA